MQNNNPEILAPAGNAEMLSAAVFAGANAVYLGLENFNARRSAGNFTIDALRQAVVFCHARNVNVYVTMNTTLYPAELAAAAACIRDAAEAGVDALIVQDLAVARLTQAIAPALALHGSTQMSVHSLAGAQQLAAMGFARVILSRELSLGEIAHITAHCGIETEVFVHGALCMCVSGQCYMSAFLGGRSGNRGACAGPCRLPFEAEAPAGQGVAAAHHLSLKDLSVIAALPALAKAGVHSVKIEGRLRTPEYAAAAVNACVQELSQGVYDKDLLQSVFSRSGFTDGYLEGKVNGTMFGTRTEGDAAAAKAAVPQLRELFRRERACVPVEFTLTLEAEGAKLAVRDDDGNKAVAYSEATPVPAQKDPAEAYAHALSKTGGTPFFARKTEVAGEPMLFLPGSEVGELRRAALEALLQKRTAPRPLQTFAPPALPLQSHAKNPSAIWAQFAHVAQMPADTAQCEALILPLAEWQQVPEALRAKTWLALPRALFGKGEETAAAHIAQSKTEGFAGYFVQNIAHVRLCAGLPMCGGFGLNITNPLSAQTYAELGLSVLTLSPELTLEDMERIAPENTRTAVLAYGHMPLMLTRACPLHNVHTCAGCKGQGMLLDRKGKRFPVRCEGPAAARTLYNPVPIYMGDKRAQLPADIALLSFTVEPRAEAARIVQNFAAGLPAEGEFTRGLYYKGTN